ncbi:hypothetical protein E2C01_096133 [Portunus trituberculatus]|uniref:Uncharacterized protein n=1 Tax=Portunus trituberculatus TaxID=210409 RepID=A0A5B7K291_PORTR|nr:hypothetical protein [Portunus trituberculatus]
MEVVAAQVGFHLDWLTVVACYNPAGPYMGSDHLLLLATLPHNCPRPHPGRLPRWTLTPSAWPRFQETLSNPDVTTLQLDQAVLALSQSLKAAGRATFSLSTRQSPRRPGKP